MKETKDLFNWNTTVTIGGNPYTVRIVDDLAQEGAQRYALIHTKKLRAKLRDTESDDYLAYVSSFDRTDDEIKQAYLGNLYKEALTDTVKKNPFSFPPLDDTASLEEKESYDENREKAYDAYRKQIIDDVESIRLQQVADLEVAMQANRITADDLRKAVETTAINELVDSEFSKRYEMYILHKSVVGKDMVTPVFTFGEFERLPERVRTAFREAYTSIVIDVEEIKN